MKKCVVVVLNKFSLRKQNESLIPNNICIIFWSNVYMVSIKEDIFTKSPF